MKSKISTDVGLQLLSLKGNDPCRLENIEYVLISKFQRKMDKYCGVMYQKVGVTNVVFYNIFF